MSMDPGRIIYLDVYDVTEAPDVFYRTYLIFTNRYVVVSYDSLLFLEKLDGDVYRIDAPSINRCMYSGFVEYRDAGDRTLLRIVSPRPVPPIFDSTTRNTQYMVYLSKSARLKVARIEFEFFDDSITEAKYVTPNTLIGIRQRSDGSREIVMLSPTAINPVPDTYYQIVEPLYEAHLVELSGVIRELLGIERAAPIFTFFAVHFTDKIEDVVGLFAVYDVGSSSIKMFVCAPRDSMNDTCGVFEIGVQETPARIYLKNTLYVYCNFIINEKCYFGIPELNYNGVTGPWLEEREMPLVVRDDETLGRTRLYDSIDFVIGLGGTVYIPDQNRFTAIATINSYFDMFAVADVVWKNDKFKVYVVGRTGVNMDVQPVPCVNIPVNVNMIAPVTTIPKQAVIEKLRVVGKMRIVDVQELPIVSEEEKNMVLQSFTVVSRDVQCTGSGEWSGNRPALGFLNDPPYYIVYVDSGTIVPYYRQCGEDGGGGSSGGGGGGGTYQLSVSIDKLEVAKRA